MNVHVSERVHVFRAQLHICSVGVWGRAGEGRSLFLVMWPTYVTLALLSISRALSIALFTCLTPLSSAAPHSVLPHTAATASFCEAHILLALTKVLPAQVRKSVS
jgi:hypothetical protein